MKRPFRGLSRNTSPESHYDVVVIGAGIGGLTCANLLARERLRVLLVEQHYMVGGYCSSFRRNGYLFDAASHFYPLLGNPATITGKLLADLGVRTQWVKMDPVDYFHFPDGTSFAVPADLDHYLGRLKAAFPAEAAPIEDYFAAARRVYLLGLLFYFRGRDTPLLDPYRDLSLRQALDSCFRDPRLKLLLTADTPHWGLPPQRTSFIFDSMLRISYFLGNYYPRGGSQAFADELARCFEEHGGHILLSSSVNRILVKNGAACGVAVSRRRGREQCEHRVAAGAVVSNADLRHTVEQLLDPGQLPPEYVGFVRRLRPTYPCFLMHIGLQNMPADVLHRLHGYHWDGWDADQMGQGALKFKLFVPTLYDPDVAPPGGQIVIVQKIDDVDYEAVTDWAAHKAALERFVVDNLERLHPGFARHMVVGLSASAATSCRYTRNHQGAMLGWEMSPDQLGAWRPGIAGPVKDLFFVGHWTQPGGGITPVIVSALRAADLILHASRTGGVPGAVGSPPWTGTLPPSAEAAPYRVVASAR
jgi:phytoene dehydrogenase-like protein